MSKRKPVPRVRYVARKVSPLSITDEQATTIALELRPLSRSNGRLHEIPAKEIVEHARRPESALHPIIWGRSDAELAYEARCQLARNVVQSIRVVVQDEDGEYQGPLAVTVRATPEGQRGYVPTADVVASPYMEQQVRDRAQQRLRGWLDEFRPFRHGGLGPLWEAVYAAFQVASADETIAARRSATAPPRGAAQSNAHHRTAPISSAGGI